MIDVQGWIAASRGRAAWLAKRLGCTSQFISLMAAGKRAIPAAMTGRLKRAMKERERAERRLG